MLYCFSLQYFIKYIIPSHAHFKAQKLICPSEIHLAGIHGALLGSRTYIIHREVFQLLSYGFTTGTDAAGMMSGKCWAGLALCSSATPAPVFHQEGGNKPLTTLKLDNSSPRFYFKAQAKRAGYFYWCYQSVSKTADSREKCKQDFKLVTLSKLTFPPPPSCTPNKYAIKRQATPPHPPKHLWRRLLCMELV